MSKIIVQFLRLTLAYCTLGVEVAAGELALRGLGECMTELPRDLDRDILEDSSQRS